MCIRDRALAWHNYAACRYLIFNDFPGSFDAFLDGFRCNAKDKVMKANFDIMMQHFHGTDKEKLAEIVKERMRVHAARDNEFNNTRQLKRELGVRRSNAAIVIKVFEFLTLPPILSFIFIYFSQFLFIYFFFAAMVQGEEVSQNFQ